ncbi:FliI/YscN family ATPase [Algicella marina]|uniref:FliI/YscN family ATPase n=1 Tax=Algicella marina TaxID=2683284 RepID=A0A6P1T0K8_9RHOB|nr:FliI/YscN family ATPase [Algicella marina]QHQ36444.1 FliI/YscN family ATPase [Algicella marina]
MFTNFLPLASEIAELRTCFRCGYVSSVGSGSLEVRGLGPVARVGDLVELEAAGDEVLRGEIVAITRESARVMMYSACEGVGLNVVARLVPISGPRPDESWKGRIIDAFGNPLDGRPLPRGAAEADLKAVPPAAAQRAALGKRLKTGEAALDTMLPLVRGQRIGIFAGSGVGKSSLLARLARGVEADIVVFALIGERGRELRHFTDHVLGEAGMARSVVITATSDQSPLIKRRAAWMAMSVAEYFRDQGKHVLFLADSVTRLAEAHREVALTAGEAPSLRAFPPSTSNLIANFAERAGPGPVGAGHITAVFSVLVAGSDMEEPVADITRGLLDGHVVLSREIAERGRFPAIDVRRSVSRSLPDAATAEENALIERTRALLGAYEMAEPMIQTGLYTPGSDPEIDAAIVIWPKLDAFFARQYPGGPAEAFAALKLCFEG